MDKKRGCFQFGAIMYKASMGILVQIVVWAYVLISIGRYLGVESYLPEINYLHL